MAKVERYEAPALPEEFAEQLAPPLDGRIAEVTQRLENAKGQGYLWFQDARAQQAAAEDALKHGDSDRYAAFINGVPPNPNVQGSGLQGVKSMDAMARTWWAKAKVYKAELDALTAEKAAQPAPADEVELDGEG